MMQTLLKKSNSFFIENVDQLSFDDFTSILEGNLKLEISVDLYDRIDRAHQVLKRKLEDPHFRIYGVNTGFGQNAKTFFKADENLQLQENLISYLDCGEGKTLNFETSKLTLLLRITNFLQARSGVSSGLVQSLVSLFNGNCIPVLPAEGSLGASGDLIPLASIGSVLKGLGECYFGSEKNKISGEQALSICGLTPFLFGDKDALGLVNGTSMMTAIATQNINECELLLETLIENMAEIFRIKNFNMSFLSVNVHEKAKPHIGQVKVAKALRRFSCVGENVEHRCIAGEGNFERPMQYPYSIRCVPQILGPLYDFLEYSKSICFTEMTSVNDNPLVSIEDNQVYSGGNFYGGHIGLISDGLKAPLSQMASLIDRQVLLFCDDRTNFFMPMNLSDSNQSWDHGLKGYHQYCTSLFCELVGKISVSSSHTRSTKTHNQDIISLGTHAARQVQDLLILLRKMIKIHSIVTLRIAELSGEDIALPRFRKLQRNLTQATHQEVFSEDELLVKERRSLDGI